MQRNDLVIRAKTSIAQTLPAAFEEVKSFLQAVKDAHKMKEYAYPKELIGNTDETLMFFDKASNKSVES